MLARLKRVSLAVSLTTHNAEKEMITDIGFNSFVASTFKVKNKTISPEVEAVISLEQFPE